MPPHSSNWLIGLLLWVSSDTRSYLAHCFAPSAPHISTRSLFNTQLSATRSRVSSEDLLRIYAAEMSQPSSIQLNSVKNKKKKQTLHQKLVQAQTQVAELQYEKEALTVELEEQQQLMSQANITAGSKESLLVMERMTQQLKLLQETNARLAKENQELASLQETNERLEKEKAELASLQEANERLQKEKEELHKQDESLLKEKQEWVACRTAIEVELKSAKEECRRLQKELVVVQQTQLEATIQSLMSQVDAAKDRLAEVIANKVELESELILDAEVVAEGQPEEMTEEQDTEFYFASTVETQTQFHKASTVQESQFHKRQVSVNVNNGQVAPHPTAAAQVLHPDPVLGGEDEEAGLPVAPSDPILGEQEEMGLPVAPIDEVNEIQFRKPLLFETSGLHGDIEEAQRRARAERKRIANMKAQMFKENNDLQRSMNETPLQNSVQASIPRGPPMRPPPSSPPPPTPPPPPQNNQAQEDDTHNSEIEDDANNEEIPAVPDVPEGDRTLYHILGAKRTDTRDVIKKKFVKLVKESHPDALVGKSLEEIKETKLDFAEIAAAWRTLANPEARSRYDRELRAKDPFDRSCRRSWHHYEPPHASYFHVQ